MIQQAEGEATLRVRPYRAHLPSPGVGKADEAFLGVLVAVLGVDEFAFREGDGAARDIDLLARRLTRCISMPLSTAFQTAR